MSTSNVNNILFGLSAGQGFSTISLPCADGTAHINQGDLVYLDSSAHILKSLDSDAHAATFVGMALQPSIASSNLDNGTIGLPAKIAVATGGSAIVQLKTTASDSYTVGAPVYAGADAQTVTVVSGSNLVGYVAEGPVTGAAGVMVKINLKSKLF